jgi:amylovoran biosynthesis glycosyltransferase AmsD
LSQNPDVIYTRLWYASLLAWVSCRRPRLVFNEESRLKPHGVKDWLRLFLLRRAGTWVVPCQGLYDEAVALGTPAPRGCVMPNIVPVAPELPARTCGPLTLGFLGRLEPAKGLDRLVAVAAGLKARGVDYRLVVAGSGSQEAALRGAIATHGLHGHVQLLGAVSDLTGFFQGVDLLVLTSRYEGFANVIVEANAYGVPALAMRVPHGPADVIREGENGFLVADGDVEAMVAKVAGLERAALLAMRAGCRALAEGTYSVQAQQVRWQALLEATT